MLWAAVSHLLSSTDSFPLSPSHPLFLYQAFLFLSGLANITSWEQQHNCFKIPISNTLTTARTTMKLKAQRSELYHRLPVGTETRVLCQLSRGAVQLEQRVPCTPSECLTRLTGDECSGTLKHCHFFKWQAAFSPSTLGYRNTKRIQTKMGGRCWLSQTQCRCPLLGKLTQSTTSYMDFHLFIGKL